MSREVFATFSCGEVFEDFDFLKSEHPVIRTIDNIRMKNLQALIQLFFTGMAESAFPAEGFRKLLRAMPFDSFVFGNNHLGDPFSGVDSEGNVGEVD